MRFVNYFEANEISRSAASLRKRRGSTRESLGNRRARAKGSHLTQSALEPLILFSRKREGHRHQYRRTLPSTCA